MGDFSLLEDPIRAIRFEAHFGRYQVVVQDAPPHVTVDSAEGVETTTSVPQVEIEINHWPGDTETPTLVAHAFVATVDAMAVGAAILGAARIAEDFHAASS